MRPGDGLLHDPALPQLPLVGHVAQPPPGMFQHQDSDDDSDATIAYSDSDDYDEGDDDEGDDDDFDSADDSDATIAYDNSDGDEAGAWGISGGGQGKRPKGYKCKTDPDKICGVPTKSGKPCSRHTCLYSTYCWQHHRKLSGLRVAHSSIKDGGLGLWTTRPFRAGEAITEYGGELMTKAEFAARPSDYGLEFKKGFVLDSVSTQSKGLGRWANQCKAENRHAGHCKGNNARFSVYHGNKRRGLRPSVTLRAMGNGVPAGAEVFVNYQNNYWRENA